MKTATSEVNCLRTELQLKLTVLCIEEGDCYECYLRVEHSPYKFMFGLPADQQSFKEANEIAIANAPCYLDLFDDDEY